MVNIRKGGHFRVLLSQNECRMIWKHSQNMVKGDLICERSVGGDNYASSLVLFNNFRIDFDKAGCEDHECPVILFSRGYLLMEQSLKINVEAGLCSANIM